MINIFALSSLVLATLHMAVAPVSAHGFVSQPPSRQALCRDVPVPGCGDVKYEPQSVEALKGSFACNGDGARFPQLNDESLWVDYVTQVYPGDAPLTFTWTLTAPHATATWEYFVLTADNTLLTTFNDHGATPSTTVVHQVPLRDYTGRQTILARWNIDNTPMAFYACVDLDISSNTATAVAGAAATQMPIGIRLGEGLGLAANGSANAGPSVNMHLRNGFITHKGSS
ncbi:immunoglobulin E-set [Mycena galopus ATCC 62051]|nr:immunoglobulin E-set [Mycena galopus ATCC 62051]